MATTGPAVADITPYELSRQMTLIVAEVCGCAHTWMTHKGQVTPKECEAIRLTITKLMCDLEYKTEAQR